MASTVLAAAAPATGLGASAASAAEVSAQAPGFYRYKIGDLEVTAINDGIAMRPLEGFVRNAPLEEVQKTLKDAFLPTDKLAISFTTLVVKSGGRTILIDTGNGDMGAPTSGSWMRNFRAAGFDPANVDLVIISHFHGDHINGLRLKDGTTVFPKAEIMVPATEWAYWMDDAKMAQAPEGLKGNFANVRRVFGQIAKDVTQYAADKEIAPGITSVATPGHTPGHTSYVIASGADKMFAMSDVTNHPVLFARHPDWAAVFDMDGDLAAKTRKRVLDMAASERLRVAFYHAPFPANGHIARDGDGYELVPASWSPVI
jgi:glyoxylase-like metal-dependent hydrolase (beta-lactamase superfamily II)